MMDLVPPDALLSEAFKSIIGFPDLAADIGASSISKALEAFWKKRTQEAQVRICDELRKGNITLTQASLTDDHFAACVRMAQAVRDCASHEAIRLMAKVMVGQIQRDRLYADDFNKYANLVSSLSRNEIIAISFLELARSQVDELDSAGKVMEKLVEISVPSSFQTKSYLEAYLMAATRSGLVLLVATYGGQAFMPSPLMDEIVQLADFQDTLRAEGVRMPDDHGRQEPHL